MDILYIPLIPLAIASIEDLLKKAVSDEINYGMIIVTAILAIILYIFYHIYPNIVVAMLILLAFLILYCLRAIAIGDVFIFLWLSYFLAYFNAYQLLKFFIYLFLFGYLIAMLYSSKIIYKKNKFYAYSLLFLSVLGGSLLLIIYIFLYFNNVIMLISVGSMLLSFVLYKKYEDFIKNSLVFKRKPQELVEGDWIEKIEINKKVELNLSKRKFKIEHKDGKTIIFPIERCLGFMGLSKNEINLLKNLNTETIIYVREGFPLVPAIFLAYLFAMI